jgi:phage terminase small subunit
MPILKNQKHESFCQAYVSDPERNASRAYLKVYPTCNNPDKTASLLLKKLEVRARVVELTEPAANRVGLNEEWVLKELVRTYKKSHEPQEIEEWVDGEKVGTGVFEFDSKGATKCLELIGKHLRMYTDRVDHTTNGKEMLLTPNITVVNGETAANIAKLTSGTSA